MSCERRVKTFTEVKTVTIECCNKEELLALEKNIELAINQKLDKLNILIKNCDVYFNGECILVNDRYNICSGLIDVAEAFGLTIKQIDCSLKGKTYVISDELLSVLKQLGISFNFGEKVANKEIDAAVEALFKKYSPTHSINKEILDMVANIMENGVYTTTKSREVSEVYEEGYGNRHLVSRDEGEWNSNEKVIREKLLSFSKEAQKTVSKVNGQLRDGTTKLIYTRARQMGYTVQEVKKGTQVQLVLVRY